MLSILCKFNFIPSEQLAKYCPFYGRLIMEATHRIQSRPQNADPTTGVVSCEWEVDIGNSDSEVFIMGIIVDGYYHAEDNTLVSVSKPVENSITGGGHLINEY